MKKVWKINESNPDMTDQSIIKPYETCVMNSVTGETLRPGGITLTKRSLEFCEFAPDSILLDIGCGYGATVRFLRANGFISYGLDRSLKLLTGPSNTSVRFLADGQTVPFPSGLIDGIFLECSLSVMDDPEKVLTEIFRLLKPGGMLIVSDMYARNPAGIGPLRATLTGGCFRSICTETEITAMIKSINFEKVLWEDHSETIRNMMGRIIFEYGSMDKFWCTLFERTKNPYGSPLNFQLLLSRARVGYFLMIAHKP